MKKNICKVVCCAAAVAAFVSALCAATVTGSGFLDLSNIATFLFAVIAVLFAIVAVITGIYGFKNK